MDIPNHPARPAEGGSASAPLAQSKMTNKMEIMAYLIIAFLAIVPGIVATVLRKRFNWPLSVHRIAPLGLPFLVGIGLTLNLGAVLDN